MSGLREVNAEEKPELSSPLANSVWMGRVCGIQRVLEFPMLGFETDLCGSWPTLPLGWYPGWAQKPTPFLGFRSVVASSLHLLTPLGLGGQAHTRMRLLVELFVLWVFPLRTRPVGPYGVSNSRSGFWSIGDSQK